MKRSIPTLAAILIVLPAATQGQEPPHPAVGHSQLEIISCAGLPQASTQIGNATYLQYRQENRTEGALFGNDYCEATLEIINGVVINVTERKAGALITRNVLCSRIFRACAF